MNPHQTYTSSTLHDAQSFGCDIVQYKYRGLYKRFDAMGKGSDILLGDVFPPKDWDEFPVAGKMIVWDCLVADGQDMRRFSYRDRWAMANVKVRELGTPFVIVPNRPILHALEMWRTMPEWAVGLVYRDSKARFETALRIARFYRELPAALP